MDAAVRRLLRMPLVGVVLGFAAFVALPRLSQRPEGLTDWLAWAFWGALLIFSLGGMVLLVVQQRRRRSRT